MQNKTTLRALLLRQRKTLAKQVIVEHSAIICNQLIKLPEFQHSQTMGVYLPIAGEIDTNLIIANCWELTKTCYLPKITSEFQMDFYRYDKNTSLAINPLQIPEPVNSEIISPTNLDLVLVPLLAFDALGHRLGFGLGYYDRCFAFQKNHPTAKPLLIGLAHSFQQVTAITPDPWDIDLDMVVTEKDIFYCT